MDRVKVISNRVFLPGLLIFILLLLATMPLYVQPYVVILLTTVIMYVILTLSWSIFSGPTRYISLASAAFFGVGVYGSAMLGQVLPMPLVIAVGGLVSLILALFIGLLTLRLRGMYFIIFTLTHQAFSPMVGDQLYGHGWQVGRGSRPYDRLLRYARHFYDGTAYRLPHQAV
jgi:ABC-type branched-subunit amino acid transport system permease subunit